MCVKLLELQNHLHALTEQKLANKIKLFDLVFIVISPATAIVSMLKSTAISFIKR